MNTPLADSSPTSNVATRNSSLNNTNFTIPLTNHHPRIQYRPIRILPQHRNSAEGAGQLPSLTWPSSSTTKGYLLISEDPDAPLPNPTIHGLYYSIPATKTSVTAEDFEVGGDALKRGFLYGQNRRGNVYIPPRPLLDHGPHRYFFTLVALSEPIDVAAFNGRPTVEEVLAEIEGKLVRWGEWFGVYKRKWE